MLVVLMKANFATDYSPERYVVEVDGCATAEYHTFAAALSAGLQFRQEFPNSNVRLRDVVNQTTR
jgi:hypothetical protein